MSSFIVAARCLSFVLNCSETRLAAGLLPDPLGELTAHSPDPIAVFVVGRKGAGHNGQGKE